jgi:glutamyl-tRNA(Gln) amidotransferase subunit E
MFSGYPTGAGMACGPCRERDLVSEQPPPAPAGPRPPGDLNPRRDPPLDFPDRELGEMSLEDYRELGFLGGLEVHQQLDTRGKLFCRCPAGRRDTRVDAEVLRHMRPTLSELGEYDACALMEFKTHKEIVYLLERRTVCTYEMDDTPPFPVDLDAVRIGLEIGRLHGLNLVSELHVMRKQYLDGSIPTGFQRTGMLGLTGEIPFRVPELGVDRTLRIRQLSLEEDACREVTDVGHRITFRTDRLGTPLTEIVTEPDLLSPYEVQAAARLLARIVRATGRVRRGPGAARQDVNVSIAGSRRIELKGVGHHRRLPLLTHVEAYRQLNLLRIREELRRRGVEPPAVPEGRPACWTASRLVIDAAGHLRRCGYTPVKDAMERGERVLAVRLPGFAGLLIRRVQPGITFAREFSERVRVIACLTGRPFLIHSDVRDYGLDPAEWRAVRSALQADREDALVVVWGPERDAETAAREILARAREAHVGVPAETRQAYLDGTTGFERLLAGPDRMYPDTDTPPLPIRDEWLVEIESRLPELPWEREDRYAKLGLAPMEAAELGAAPWADLFDALEPEPGAIARRLAHALRKRLPHHARRGRAPLPDPGRLRPLVRALESGAIRPEATEAALDELLGSPDRAPDELLAPFRLSGDEAAEVDSRVRETARMAAALSGKPRDVLLRWAMGRVVPALLGRVDPAEASRRLEEALPEEARA